MPVIWQQNTQGGTSTELETVPGDDRDGNPKPAEGKPLASVWMLVVRMVCLLSRLLIPLKVTPEAKAMQLYQRCFSFDPSHTPDIPPHPHTPFPSLETGSFLLCAQKLVSLWFINSLADFPEIQPHDRRQKYSILYTIEPTQNKALHVYLYFGIDFSQGFFNMTISHNAQIQKKLSSLIHSSKKSSSYSTD